MRASIAILLACLFSCAEDTRTSRDAAAAVDGASSDTGDAGSTDVSGQDDDDMDGVVGAADFCMTTPAGDPVDTNGCSTADADADGVLNDMDRCPDTPSGANVDGVGCRLENEGTLDGMWLVGGAPATTASCSVAGIATVRLVIDAPGSNFLRREFACSVGGFDGREDMSAPRVPRNQSFTSYWQAINAAEEVVSESETLDLILSGDVMHASLSAPNFAAD